MKRISNIFIAAVICMFAASAALACTPIGVGKKATEDGSVCLAHTCDGWYDNRVRVIPGGDHTDGEMVDIYNVLCTDTRRPLRKVGEIPQAEKTYTYFHVGYPFMNEHQLMMSECTWSGRDELASPKGLFYIANLEVLGLQRAKTARDAIRVMGALAEKYGYADGGELLIVGDTEELWVFEICGGGAVWSPDSGMPGAHWAARRIPDDKVFVAANRSRLGVIDLSDTENTMHSTDITVLPETMGWWKTGEPFNFSKVFNPEPYGYPYYAARREWRVFNLLAPSKKLPVLAKWEMYPFALTPDKKVGVRDIMNVYSDHLEGTPYDLTKGLAAGPFGCPTRWQTPRSVRPENRAGLDWERPISLFRCSYSFVSQSRSWLPDPIGGVLWFGEDSPDTTVYVPIYCGVTSIPDAWSNCDRIHFDRNSAFWAFNLVNNWAILRWDAIYPDIRAKKASYEDKFFSEQPVIEKHALELYKKNPEKAIEYLTAYTGKTMDTVYDGWWNYAFELIGRYCDGGIMTPEGQKTPGYPTDWLEKTGFGDTAEHDLKATAR